ncbi:MAG: DUF3536 domain-containing protein [Candidatus Omnitrophica bacterium]|nr:DUF3536 domain-containing protein [Candidatus Omnitrophota bacterium]
MKKIICVHGHFYQPPRENPWLEEVEFQDSAYPYHDWNERITDECYAPNAASHILTSDGKLADIINVYTKINFDFGPTLLSWLGRHDPTAYKTILDADKKSMELFSSSHGLAIAQPYNHMIMPLASPRDKRTQIIWGIRDFEYRFGRKPEGMWLPETAVDLETLGIMVEYGIKFTILAPHQAFRERKIGDKEWSDLGKKGSPGNMPYICNLPSGGNIAIFFYNAEISHAVAFGNLLDDGVKFANKLIGDFTDGGEGAELVSIATDGETYGHHHRFGNMALAYCINHIENNNLAVITGFGDFLEKFPPAHEVEIAENTSWSCSHGIERWRGDCGCNSGVNPGWRQAWRKPLREGMDWLRERLVSVYEEHMAHFSGDPWGIRDEYISVVLDRSGKNLETFLKRHIGKKLERNERIKILKLLEMERNSMLMFTSCQWYFDDISGIEAIQGLSYAARAMQLAREISGVSLEDGYLGYLKKAHSNIPELKNGAIIYKTIIKPAIIDLPKIAAHYALSSLLEPYGDTAKIYSFNVKKEVHDFFELGKIKFAVGRVSVSSEITEEESIISYGAIYKGRYEISCWVKEHIDESSFKSIREGVRAAFQEGRWDDAASLMNRHFDGHNYKLEDILKDKKVKILGDIFYNTSKEIENTTRTIYKAKYPAAESVGLFKIPLLRFFHKNIEFTTSMELFSLLKDDERLDFKRLRELLKQAKDFSIELDKTTLAFLVSNRVNMRARQWFAKAEDVFLIEEVIELLKAVKSAGLDLSLWESQNIYFYMSKKAPEAALGKEKISQVDQKKQVELLKDLGSCLGVKIAK